MLESPSRSDGDLLRLLSGGDEKAFLEFYRKHQGMVFRFALQMSGKTEIAEEVTQDVFVAVMKSAGRYDAERGSVAAFLYGIARNFVLRALERERPYVTALDDAGRSEYRGGARYFRRPGAERAHRNAAKGSAGAAAGLSRSGGAVRSERTRLRRSGQRFGMRHWHRAVAVASGAGAAGRENASGRKVCGMNENHALSFWKV